MKNFFRNLYNSLFKKHKVGIHTANINGIPIKTGDLVFTSNASIFGYKLDAAQFIGPTNHVVMYVGPRLGFIEAGPAGVRAFDIFGPTWKDTKTYRFGLSDTFYAVSKVKLKDSERKIIANFCLKQIGKPYNINFTDSNTKNAFYCSQLIYWSYREAGIDLLQKEMSLLYDKMKLIVPFELWKVIEKYDKNGNK